MAESCVPNGASPADCRRIVIVGAGGFGREVLQWARDAWPQHAAKIAGFLSADAKKLDRFAYHLPILGTPDDFLAAPSDLFLLAVGIPRTRRAVVQSLLTQSARFATLIHPTAVVADNAAVGVGAIVGPFAIVSDAAVVEHFVLVNYHASLAHDAVAKEYAVLSPYAALGGNATIGKDSFLGLHASVGPGRSLGAYSKVSANSCVLSDAPDNCLVFGVPGRVAPRIEVGER